MSRLAWAVLALLAVLAAVAMTAGCTTIVNIDRSGCASDRRVTILRQPGQAATTIIQTRRICGQPTQSTSNL